MSGVAELRRSRGFGAALSAEWTKFRTVRGWLIALVSAGLLMVLFSYLQANGKHTGYCTSPGLNSCVAGHPFVPTGPGGVAVADTYELASQRLTGNGTITTRLASLSGRIWAGPADEAPTLADTRSGLAPWAKAGLLLTTAVKQGSSYAAIVATGAHGDRFQYDYSHDQPDLRSGAPRWLRLRRSGDTIVGYDSVNGTSWHRVGSTTFAGLPATVYVGLFATSPTTADGSATEATASFDLTTIDSALSRHHPSPRGWSEQSIGMGPRSFYPTLGDGSAREVGGSVVLTGSGDIAPAVANAGGDTASGSLLFGLVIALIVAIVVATGFIAGEYRRGLIRTTFAATPDRRAVLTAKAVVIGAAGFVTGAVASAVAIPIAEHVMKANGNYVFPAGPLALAQIVVGSGALVALTAITLLGVATILRRSAVTILVGVVVFVLPTFTGPGVLGPTSAAAGAAWIYRLAPAAGLSMLGVLPRSALVDYRYTISNGYYPLPAWAGLLVLCAYAATALCAAQLVLRRRDA